MKGANTVFVQDSKSNVVLYTRADILRSEEASEVKKFVTYWKSIKGSWSHQPYVHLDKQQGSALKRCSSSICETVARGEQII